DAPRLRLRGALRARGGGDDRRLLPGAGLLPRDLPAPGSRARRDRCVRLHPGVERVHPRGGRDDPRGPPYPAALADPVHRRHSRRRLGCSHGRLDPDRDPGRDLLPARAGTDGRRADGRGGEGVTVLESLALTVQLPGFAGPSYDDEVLALLHAGLGGGCLFGANTAHGSGALRALTRAGLDASPLAVIAVDEEGGDVSRLHAHDGSPVLGAAALGVVDDLDL